ncbi:MAG: MBL fold metallo-hydrolase [bacterium]|nr:MBL fold metallo-hydrolase [bacterium]
MKEWTIRADGGGDRIGGSNYIEKDVCIDYGAIQDNKRISYPPMAREEIPLFILSHDHLDHCGGVPIFAREHPESKILMTQTTYEGMLLQLRDSLKIMSVTAKNRTRRGLNPEQVVFDYRDVERLANRVEFVKNTDWFEPIPGYKMSFRSAGHKPGAVMILMVCPDGTRVIHACDVSLDDQALVKGASVPSDFLEPDIMVVESTYGDREIPDRHKEESKLIKIAKTVFKRGGKVVMPHFGSTMGNVAFPVAKAGLATYIDGMGRDFLSMYQNTKPWCGEDKPFSLKDFPSLSFVNGGSPKGDMLVREELIQQKGPVVIVSTSGMLEGGPSVFYTEELIEDRRNASVVPGYQASGTQGRKMVQLQRGDQISFVHQDKFGEEKTVTKKILADVIQVKLSGHSGGDKMAKWIAQINPKKVVTVHGEPSSHEGLKERTHRLSKNISFFSAKNGQTLEFAF